MKKMEREIEELKMGKGGEGKNKKAVGKDKER